MFENIVAVVIGIPLFFIMFIFAAFFIAAAGASTIDMEQSYDDFNDN
jgi:hypothetical protein